MEQYNYTIRHAQKRDAENILDLVNAEASATGALLPLEIGIINKRISEKLCIVASVKSGGKEIIVGHEAADVWPESGWVELRSAVVKPDHRGKSIGSSISNALMQEIKLRYKGRNAVAFINKNGAGTEILKKHGFTEVGIDDIPEEIFSIGPKHRGKASFGYRIFHMKLE